LCHTQSIYYKIIVVDNIIQVIKSTRMKRAEHVARMVQRRGSCRVLVGRPEGRRPLGRHKPSWKENTVLDLQE
jgi:hypothetical protein